jgi:hypothetical protein
VKEAIGSGWRNIEKPPSSKESSKDSEDESGEIEVAEELPARTITPSNIAQARNEISRSVGGKGSNELYLWHERHSGAARTTAQPMNPLSPTKLSRPGLGASHWNRWGRSGLADVAPATSVKEIH